MAASDDNAAAGAMGVDAALVARLKATRGLNLALLATAEKGDLVGLGVSELDAEVFLAWRG